MGLLDSWKSFRSDRQSKSLQKCGDVLKKVVTTKEQRIEAIEALMDAAPELAIPQLLKRFEMVIDHGLQDTKEKEMITSYIVEHKDVAAPFIREELAKAKRISWLIKIAEKIFPKEESLQLLLSNLKDEFVGFDEAVQDRNIEILLALKDFPDARIAERVKSHLSSRDEQVRIAALECLETQGQHDESARKLLLDLLATPPSDDNSRLQSLIRTTAQKHGWI